MKWWKMLPIICFMLVLPGLVQCEKPHYYFQGMVQQIHSDGTQSQMVIQTDSGEKICILTNEQTLVGSWISGIEGQQLLDGTLIQPSVNVTSNTKTSRTKIGDMAYQTYIADLIIVSEIFEENAYTLANGTPLDIRRSDEEKTFLTKDGTALLTENRPVGPDQVSVIGLPNFHSLNDSAQEAIHSWYAECGVLYDLDNEIERAYAAYLDFEEPEAFQEYFVFQEVFPSAYNNDLIWFSTDVHKSIDQKTSAQKRTCAAFYRETGEAVDIADLFTCDEDEIIISLMDRMPPAGINRRELIQAFRTEYLNFSTSGLLIWFPAGSLANEEHSLLLNAAYSQIEDILKDWAIPAEQDPA